MISLGSGIYLKRKFYGKDPEALKQYGQKAAAKPLLVTLKKFSLERIFLFMEPDMLKAKFMDEAQAQPFPSVYSQFTERNLNLLLRHQVTDISFLRGLCLSDLQSVQLHTIGETYGKWAMAEKILLPEDMVDVVTKALQQETSITTFLERNWDWPISPYGLRLFSDGYKNYFHKLREFQKDYESHQYTMKVGIAAASSRLESALEVYRRERDHANRELHREIGSRYSQPNGWKTSEQYRANERR